MTNITDIREMKARITVFGVGGAGGNAVNNMIAAGLQGVEFVVANTDAQALTMSKTKHIIQMGTRVTQGLGAGSQPDVGRAAAEEAINAIRDHFAGSHMMFVTAGMGGGTGTGAAPVIAEAAREFGILTIGVVTKPFHFEGQRRMRLAEAGIVELQKVVDTLLIIPNQNLFRVTNERRLLPTPLPWQTMFFIRVWPHYRPDSQGRSDQSGLCRRTHCHAREGQGDDGHG